MNDIPVLKFNSFPTPFSTSTETVSFDTVSCQKKLATIHYFVSKAVVSRYREITESLQDYGTNSLEDQTHIVPPCLTSVVGLLKLALGGPWPEDTIHVRQEIQTYSVLRTDKEIVTEVSVDEAYVRRGRQVVVLRSTTGHLDGG